jgi:O-6-methylguanine DNA methyltransferase
LDKYFYEKVYKVVAKIPKGKVLSYQEVARRAGSPRACRAVGNIMNRHNIKNLPCHRVIRSDGSVGGYRWGTKRKIKRLQAEGVKISKNGKIIGFKR